MGREGAGGRRECLRLGVTVARQSPWRKRLTEEFVEFVDQVAEVSEGGVDGGRFFHVDAGGAEEVERELGAAPFRKLREW